MNFLIRVGSLFTLLGVNTSYISLINFPLGLSHHCLKTSSTLLSNMILALNFSSSSSLCSSEFIFSFFFFSYLCKSLSLSELSMLLASIFFINHQWPINKICLIIAKFACLTFTQSWRWSLARRWCTTLVESVWTLVVGRLAKTNRTRWLWTLETTYWLSNKRIAALWVFHDLRSYAPIFFLVAHLFFLSVTYAFLFMHLASIFSLALAPNGTPVASRPDLQVLIFFILLEIVTFFLYVARHHSWTPTVVEIFHLIKIQLVCLFIFIILVIVLFLGQVIRFLHLAREVNWWCIHQSWLSFPGWDWIFFAMFLKYRLINLV